MYVIPLLEDTIMRQMNNLACIIMELGSQYVIISTYDACLIQRQLAIKDAQEQYEGFSFVQFYFIQKDGRYSAFRNKCFM